MSDLNQDIHDAVVDGLCEVCDGWLGCRYNDCYKDCDGYKEEYASVKKEWEIEAAIMTEKEKP